MVFQTVMLLQLKVKVGMDQKKQLLSSFVVVVTIYPSGVYVMSELNMEIKSVRERKRRRKTGFSSEDDI